MFVGHYSAAFFGKAVEPRVPFWVLFLAAQLVDVFWAIFIMLGIEKASLDPGLPSSPLVLDYMPYTHSLAGTFVWAAVAFVLARRITVLGGAGRAAVVVAAVVASHWFLDLIVHRPDLPLDGDQTVKLGLALWNYPVPAFVAEMALLFASIIVWCRRSGAGMAARRAGRVFIVGFLILQLGFWLGPVPPVIEAVAASALFTFLLIAWAGARIERRITETGAAPAN